MIRLLIDGGIGLVSLFLERLRLMSWCMFLRFEGILFESWLCFKKRNCSFGVLRSDVGMLFVK